MEAGGSEKDPGFRGVIQSCSAQPFTRWKETYDGRRLAGLPGLSRSLPPAFESSSFLLTVNRATIMVAQISHGTTLIKTPTHRSETLQRGALPVSWHP